MRFWQKIFICSLVLLILAISLVATVILAQTHEQNLLQTRLNGIRTHDLFSTAVQTTLIHDRYQAGEHFLDRAAMLESFARLTESYNKQYGHRSKSTTSKPTLYAELYADGQLVYSNLPFTRTDSHPEQADLSESGRNTVFIEQDGRTWLFVTSLIQLENQSYCLSTARDVSYLYTQLDSLLLEYADLMLIIATAAAAILLLLVILLTRPIAVLRAKANRIASGDYSQRLAVKGSDELAELGRDFNDMADAVEQNITILQQMNEDRTRFIDNLSHEIKSPLTAIIGFADILRRTPQIAPEERMRQADYIYREGKHLEHISRLLMELILLGRTKPDLDQVLLSDLVHETVNLSQPMMDSRQLVLKGSSSPGSIRVNRELIRSLLSNLLDNAAKASSPGGEIKLQAAIDAQNRPFLSVQDYGRGIPESEIDKIRQPFYMLDKARTRSAGGAGLGLALCEEIARVHDAEMVIESKIGAGTEVRIIFPREASV
ncbi:MAG: HAMP domain-containing sensor histidine kinase [Clostridiaceae bacterium]|nr:HAMP domain-containing sensor histidine kinase [Clostridiaceae bacterium]